MPLYEYECLENKHHFELIQKINARPIKKCKYCDSQVKKLVSSGGFILKGEGFYVNDYARKEKKEEVKAEKKPAQDKSLKK